MSIEVDIDVERNDISKEQPVKEQKSVSFNKDVHVKRFGKPRETRSSSTDRQTPIRKEPFTHLSEDKLIEEANKVRAQAESVLCTSNHPPEKFYSLPHRKKNRDHDKIERKNSDEPEAKKTLGRSISDASAKKKRTSLSTLFRKSQKNKNVEVPVKVTTKPVVIVKRSKSDVSDLKSNAKLNIQNKPIRKRSGSETEEFLKSLRNSKAPLTPIIENSPRSDYFGRKPIIVETIEKENLRKTVSDTPDIKKIVNPVEKPPRYKSPEKDPKPPTRTKRGLSLEKELINAQPITSTPKRQVEIKKSSLANEIDTGEKISELRSIIKENIRKIEENIYGTKEMVHSSQQPVEKLPLTKGQTVDHMVKILKDDQTLPRKSLISPQNSTNNNQPFSYTKPSVSPDPNLFARSNSPERIPSPINKMNNGIVYAQVVRDNSDNGSSSYKKQTVHKTYSPSNEKLGTFSDEDEGLGYDYRTSPRNGSYQYAYQKDNSYKKEGFKITDSPIKPRFREYKLTSFEDYEPTYANNYPEEKSRDVVDAPVRGTADGMDNKIRSEDLGFNELSHRRHLLESRINARIDRERQPRATMTSYLLENDPSFNPERLKATEKYVNETARYFHHTQEKNGFKENKISEDYSRYGSDNNNMKYNTESRYTEKIGDSDIDGESDIPKHFREVFPPEPEYEPPSLEINSNKLTSDEYKEKKYKVKTRHYTSHDSWQSESKPDFGQRKELYASNPEINKGYNSIPESYHSLRRETKINRHDSGDSRDYRKYDVDNRLFDSGIENDFRKEFNTDIQDKYKRYESDDDVHETKKFLHEERKSVPSKTVYTNGEYISRFDRKENSKNRGDVDSPDDVIKDSEIDEKVSAKPPKVKKLTGLEKVKQLFSRDSSKKSKKEETTKPRTRILKSPDHLEEYKRYRDPVPSDEEPRRDSKSSREDIDRYRSLEQKESDDDRSGKKYQQNYYRKEIHTFNEDRIIRKSRKPKDGVEYKNRLEYKETPKEYTSSENGHKESRYKINYSNGYSRSQIRGNSSDRESVRNPRNSDGESDRERRRRNIDSPAMAEKYRERRRLATPSPTPSPPRRQEAPVTSSGGWFKSLDRITKKKSTVNEKDYTKNEEKPKHSPAKNLRFFGDTDQDSDGSRKYTNSKQTLRKTISNSSNYSSDERKERKLQNIREVNHSDNDGSFRRVDMKPPLNPARRSRSHSSTKNVRREDLRERQEVRGSKQELRGSKQELRGSKQELRGSKQELRGSKQELRGSEQELRGSKQELRGSKQDVRSSRQDLRNSRQDVRSSRQELREKSRRAHGNYSGESSTEGESGQSQKGVVFLHATTVGDIPDPGRLSRNRSRDDVSSVNSSNLQIKTTQKSFSLFAPWTPKLHTETNEVNYAQYPKEGTLQKNKSYSQTTLNRRQPSSRLSHSSTTLNRKGERRDDSGSSTLSHKKSHSQDLLNSERGVQRTMSMPKDKLKKSSWFNLSNKNKKDVNTRVR